MKKILIVLCMIFSITLKSYSQTVYYNQLTDEVSIGLGTYDTDKVYFSFGSYSMNDEFNDFSFRLVTSNGYEKFNIGRFGIPIVNHISATDYGYIFNECIYVLDRHTISFICNSISPGDVLYINGYSCGAMDFIYILNKLNVDYISPQINLVIRNNFYINYNLLPIYSPFHRDRIRHMPPPMRVYSPRRMFVNPPRPNRPNRPIISPRTGRDPGYRGGDRGIKRPPVTRPNTTNRPAGNPSRGGVNPGRSGGGRR